jgi:hypothetical protein
VSAARRGLLGSGLLVLLLGCAGDLTVRAPLRATTPGQTPLAAVGPLTVHLPQASGPAHASDPVGERAAGLGVPQAGIHLTEPPGIVLHRLVADELRAAGQGVDGDAGDVTVVVQVEEFSVRSPRSSPGWEVSAIVRMVLRISKGSGDEDFTELVYTAERSGPSWLPPGVGRTERILAECLSDLAALLSGRQALASALRRYAAAP